MGFFSHILHSYFCVVLPSFLFLYFFLFLPFPFKHCKLSRSFSSFSLSLAHTHTFPACLAVLLFSSLQLYRYTAKVKVKWLEGYPQHWRAGEESPHLQRIFHLPEQTCWLYTTSVLCLYSSSHKTYWPTAISHIGRQGRVADIS